MPCSTSAECASTPGFVCAPIWLGGPGAYGHTQNPEYACEMPLPDPAALATTGGCPAGTQVWVALLSLPAADGSFQKAYYCGLNCDIRKADSENYGVCPWGRQCIGICVR